MEFQSIDSTTDMINWCAHGKTRCGIYALNCGKMKISTIQSQLLEVRLSTYWVAQSSNQCPQPDIDKYENCDIK